MKVLLAPDKFKGSLTAAQVVHHLGSGLDARGVEHRGLPLADGGDGSVAAAVAAGFGSHEVTVAAATGDPHTAIVAFDGTTAVVEVANTCGLHTVTELAPLRSSSAGLGEAVRAVLRLGATRIVLALGGSASTDGGAGMLAALGAVFRDAAGQPLRIDGGTLSQVHAVDMSGLPDLGQVEIVIASDVQNPLIALPRCARSALRAGAVSMTHSLHSLPHSLAHARSALRAGAVTFVRSLHSLTGPDGAAAVFGPQKGADPEQVRLLDDGLAHFVDVLAGQGYGHAPQLAAAAGAGAAGGVGFGAMLLGGRAVSGADFFLDLLDFAKHVNGCDLVITGEGRIDDQTLHGKLPAVVAQRAAPVPVIAVVGRSDLSERARQAMGLSAVHAVVDHTDGDPAHDPALTARVVEELGRTIPLPGRPAR